MDIANFEARMSAMARPTYGAVARHAPDGAPAIVFVPTRKHAKLLSLDLLTFAAADGAPRRFLNCEPEDLAPHLERVSDPAAAHALRFGVALAHESMDAAELETVELVATLFDGVMACMLGYIAGPNSNWCTTMSGASGRLARSCDFRTS